LEADLFAEHPDADLSAAGDRVRVAEAARTALANSVSTDSVSDTLQV